MRLFIVLIPAHELAVWRIEILRSRLNFIVNDIFCCYRQQSAAATANVKKIIEQIHIRIWEPFKYCSVLKT